MILNSLCALALGFALDMCLGNSGKKFSATGIIRWIIKKITKFLKGAYADSPAAQGAAGGVLVFFTLFVVIGISLIIVMAAYKIHVILGIVCEGLLCKTALDIRNVRLEATGIYRAVKTENENLAAKRLKKFSGRNTDEMTMEELSSLGIETISKRTNEFAVAPIFYIMLLGGMGGILYRTIYLLDEFAGHRTRNFRWYGRASARLKDILDFIPAKISSWIIILDCFFLQLKGKNAISVYKRDRKKAFSYAAGHMEAAVAGGLGIALYSPEFEDLKTTENQQVVWKSNIRDKKIIGTALKDISSQDIYWSIQLFCGTAAYSLILAAVVRVALFIIF